MSVFGHGDEEKRVCGHIPHLPNNDCVIVSLGSNNVWDFEVDIGVWLSLAGPPSNVASFMLSGERFILIEGNKTNRKIFSIHTKKHYP